LQRNDEALVAYNNAITLKPDFAYAWSNNGAALDDLKRYDEALAAYDRALSFKSDDAHILRLKGSTLCALRRYDEVLDAYEQALAHKADDAHLWSGKGSALHALQRYEEALAAHDHAIALNLDHVNVWNNKGNTLLALERYEEALAAYEHASQLNANLAYVWSNKGKVLAILHRFGEALDADDRGIALKPDDAEIWSNKGSALCSLHRYEEALDAYEHALALDVDNADLWFDKGVTLHELKRYDEALAAYDRAIALKSDYAHTWNNRGSALFGLKRYEEALASYDRAITIDPGYAVATANKGRTLSVLKRYEAALAAREQAICLDPSDANRWVGKALDLCNLGRYEDALAASEEAVRLQPEDPQALEMRNSIKRGLHRTAVDQRLLLRDGRWLGFIDCGDPDGSPVMCFHGLPGSRLDYAEDQEMLKALHVRLIAPDRPGYGLSDFQRRRRLLDWSDDVAELTEHLGIERFAVLGVSGGGAYAAVCAYWLPNRVTRAGLVSSASPLNVPGLIRSMDRFNRLRFGVLSYIPWPVRLLGTSLVARFARAYPEVAYQARNEQLLQADHPTRVPRKLAPVTTEIVTEPYQQGGRGYAWDGKLAVRPWGFRLEDISSEVYLWHGEQDMLAPLVMGKYLAQTIPHCHATFLPEEGHGVINQHLREILTALTAQ
jgi:tetratricopeptide (TPR) repeat protein